jgi:membrane protein DedA with SNARE-associated domain
MSGAHLQQLVGSYGAWAVFFFVAIESTGIPFPGETVLLTAAVYAGTTHRLDIRLVVAAAAAGAILGDNLGYFVGRQGGFRMLRWLSTRMHVNERKLKLGQYLFRLHGGKVVFFGRFVAVLRSWAAFLAGTNLMPWPRFLIFNALGGVAWAALYGFGAATLGASLKKVAGPVGIALGVVAVVAIVSAFLFVRRHEKDLEDRAVRALPGPLMERTTAAPS